MTNDAFDALVAAADPAMVVVTVAGDEPAGCLVGFHSQAGIDPHRYVVWLSKANRTYGVALGATHLGVHLLSEGDGSLARRFGAETGDEVDKFAGLSWTPGPGDVPLLDACPRRFVIRRTVVVDEGGDHACFSGEVETTTATGAPFRPLRLSQVVDLVPGHDAAERRSPTTPVHDHP
jgi:flavin reductase (DIM6/NTAB) family NADH-FMN oxidoreductase RutF